MNKGKKQDKGTYVVVRLYRLASVLGATRSRWCCHAFLLRDSELKVGCVKVLSKNMES